MIWAKCPKAIFVNKRRVKRAVTEAVCEYNKGTVRTIVETQKALGVATGGSTKQLATILDCRKQKFRKRRQNAMYGPFVFGEPIVTGYAYLDTLQLWVFPPLKESEPEIHLVAR
ncbi:hypothetical protein TNCV_4849681 [Trichonephila clavipes]|nr:hypothetical protein TNCV_4849681 [Trichonephila clavipes]